MNGYLYTKIFKSDEYITTYGTNNEKGSGFGLNLCKEFVIKLGGNISVESETGIGTSFYFTVPKANDTITG